MGELANFRFPDVRLLLHKVLWHDEGPGEDRRVRCERHFHPPRDLGRAQDGDVLTSSCPARLAAGKSWLLIRSIVYFTSSAVNGAPSCQVTPLRSFSLQRAAKQRRGRTCKSEPEQRAA
jgi:hypothetical protein